VLAMFRAEGFCDAAVIGPLQAGRGVRIEG
jgi:hypothetical protein